MALMRRHLLRRAIVVIVTSIVLFVDVVTFVLLAGFVYLLYLLLTVPH